MTLNKLKEDCTYSPIVAYHGPGIDQSDSKIPKKVVYNTERTLQSRVLFHHAICLLLVGKEFHDLHWSLFPPKKATGVLLGTILAILCTEQERSC